MEDWGLEPSQASLEQAYIKDDLYLRGIEEGERRCEKRRPSRFVWFAIGVLSTVASAGLAINWVGPITGNQ